MTSPSSVVCLSDVRGLRLKFVHISIENVLATGQGKLEVHWHSLLYSFLHQGQPCLRDQSYLKSQGKDLFPGLCLGRYCQVLHLKLFLPWLSLVSFVSL